MSEERILPREENGVMLFVPCRKKMIRETDGESLSAGLRKESPAVWEGILGPDFAERIRALTKT